jgi:hypothetical protein
MMLPLLGADGKPLFADGIFTAARAHDPAKWTPFVGIEDAAGKAIGTSLSAALIADFLRFPAVTLKTPVDVWSSHWPVRHATQQVRRAEMTLGHSLARALATLGTRTYANPAAASVEHTTIMAMRIMAAMKTLGANTPAGWRAPLPAAHVVNRAAIVFGNGTLTLGFPNNASSPDQGSDAAIGRIARTMGSAVDERLIGTRQIGGTASPHDIDGMARYMHTMWYFAQVDWITPDMPGMSAISLTDSCHTAEATSPPGASTVPAVLADDDDPGDIILYDPAAWFARE